MDEDAKLRLMQKRIIKSYAWQRDIVVPLSKEFECSVDELEDVFFDLFDLGMLEALHGTFESAQDICLSQKLHADLRLCWFIGSLEVITPEDGERLKEKLIEESKKGKSYDEILKDGRLELFELLKEESKR